jgi:predicted DsbA family dithiol-disulfide isomerase
VAGVRIEVFSDVVCPWCYIGTRRLARAIDAAVADGCAPPVVEMQPFQLDPGAPAEPTPVIEAYAKRFGEKAPGILAHVTNVAREDGIALRFDSAQRANTRRAHLALEHARTAAGPRAQWTLSDLLFRAYFEDGADVGDPATIAELASRAGVDGASEAIIADDGTIDAALRRAADLGITAVPTFVVDGRWSIPGAQDTETFVRIIRRLSA